jgi:hypothetical protein
LVLVIALGCAAGYAQTPARAIKPESPAVAQWSPLVPSIQKTLEESDKNCVGGPAPGIVDAFGLSGDALSVALVDFCGRGAYTDAIVVMRRDHGKPVPAKFRDARLKRVENGFANGASAMHTVSVRLVAEKEAVYDSFADSDAEGKPYKCGVKAYVWNAGTETFDLNLRLSKSASLDYCRSLRENK